MRKIEAQMIEQINIRLLAMDRSEMIAGTWRSANTEVSMRYGDFGGQIMVRLHGNLIATFQGGFCFRTLAGWNTNTTRSRLNAIGRQFGLDSFSTRRGEPLFRGDRIGANEWAVQNVKTKEVQFLSYGQRPVVPEAA